MPEEGCSAPVPIPVVALCGLYHVRWHRCVGEGLPWSEISNLELGVMGTVHRNNSPVSFLSTLVVIHGQSVRLKFHGVALGA